MKKILILLCIIAAVTASAQKQPYNVFKGDTINRTDAKGLKQGIWKKYYSNDSLFSVGQYQNGHPYGVFKTYYKTGEPQSFLTYRIASMVMGSHIISSNVADMTIYYESGKRKAQGKYINQKKDSVWNYYGEEGSLSSRELYVNGVEEGVWKTYYENGTVSREVTYSKGKRNGPYKEYFGDGKIKVEARMMDDNYEGLVTMYYPNGKIWMQGKYIKHLREGDWNVYDQSGKKTAVKKYKNGDLLNPTKDEDAAPGTIPEPAQQKKN